MGQVAVAARVGYAEQVRCDLVAIAAVVVAKHGVGPEERNELRVIGECQVVVSHVEVDAYTFVREEPPRACLVRARGAFDAGPDCAETFGAVREAMPFDPEITDTVSG